MNEWLDSQFSNISEQLYLWAIWCYDAGCLSTIYLISTYFVSVVIISCLCVFQFIRFSVSQNVCNI